MFCHEAQGVGVAWQVGISGVHGPVLNRTGGSVRAVREIFWWFGSVPVSEMNLTVYGSVREQIF
jgi:hypothetical protein